MVLKSILRANRVLECLITNFAEICTGLLLAVASVLCSEISLNSTQRKLKSRKGSQLCVRRRQILRLESEREVSTVCAEKVH